MVNNIFCKQGVPCSPCITYPIPCSCQLTVEGRGSVYVKPDMATAILGVVTEKLQLTTAQQENAVKTSAVIRAVLQTGIPSEDIQTQTYQIEPMYDFIEGRQVFRGYRVTHNLRITIKNVDSVGRVIDAAVNAGANTVNSIRFSVSNPSAYYQQALNAAIDDVIDKAAAIGGKLHVQVSRVPVRITEESYQTGVPFELSALPIAAATTPVQPGQIEITAQISAIFVYS